VINQEGLSIFRFDKNIIIIKASQTYAFLTVTQKPIKTLIRLWHRRFGHLGLDNVQKTSKIVKGIKLKKNKFVNQKDKDLRLCDLCEKEKATRHVQKHTEPHNLKVFNKVYINVIIITPQGIRKKKYAIVFTKKATSTC
jgi:hypothetical protein